LLNNCSTIVKRLLNVVKRLLNYCYTVVERLSNRF